MVNLKRSFLIPLTATLRAAGLKLDVDTANHEALRWLKDRSLDGHRFLSACDKRPLDRHQLILA